MDAFERTLSDAERMATLWRFQARICETHFGWTADNFVSKRPPFNHLEAFAVIDEIARIECRVSWDGFAKEHA